MDVGGIVVHTGDLIHSDYGGCVVIPEANHPWTVEACSLVLDFEKRVHTATRRTDMSYRDKRVLVDEFVAAHRHNIEDLKQGI